MGDDQPQDYFVELVSSMSYANGVFRATLGQQEVEGRPRANVRLLIPANQFSAILKAMADGASQLSERVKEKDERAKNLNGPDAGENERVPSKKK